MGLLDGILKKFKKKETTVSTMIPNPAQQMQQTDITGSSQRQSENQKFLENLNQRITVLENELNRVNMSYDATKREISEIRTDIDGLRENVKMVVSLYEMVSKDYNPFMDTTPEEIKDLTDSLKENIVDLRHLVDSAMLDLKELYGVPDMDSIISDIELEGTDDQ